MNTNVDVPSPEPGPKPQLDLRRALNHAVKVAQYLSTSDVLDEETLTGSILGALSASLGFCVEPRDTDPIEASKKFFWARYNKGTARKNEHSEARNGADFALVLINEHGIRRLAIFQAKKGKVSRPDPTKPKWKIDTYREGKDEKEHPSDVPPRLSSTTVWSPILNDKEIGREEALYRRTDHWLPA